MTNEQAMEYGRQAGKAVNRRDQSAYQHLRDWFRRAVAVEQQQAELNKAWDEGYREECSARLAFLQSSASR